MNRISSLAFHEQEALMSLRRALQKLYGNVQMIFFGSKSVGAFEEKQELDLFILLEHCDWQIEQEIYKMCSEIELKNDIHLSPIVYSLHELKNIPVGVLPFFDLVGKRGVAV